VRVVEFGSLFQFIRNGMSIKQDKSGDGLPITRIETIADATVDAKRVGYAGVSEEDGRRWLLEPGDILFSHINSVEHVGKCAMYRGVPEKLVHGMNLLCMRCDQSQLLPEFATYLIRSPGFRARLQNFINKAVNQASVSIGNLKPIPVGIPPLPEQRRIAAILDQADALRAKRREALAQLDSLTQSIFIEMFGDPVSNVENWPTKTLKELGRVKTGGTPPSSKEGMFNGEIPFVTPGDLGHNEPAKRMVTSLGAAEAETARGGSALVCCIGATIGKMAKASQFCAFNQQINAVEWGRAVNDDFGISALGFFKLQIATLGASTTLPILKKSSFEKIEIPIPPLALQENFSVRIWAVEALKIALRSSLAELDTLFASLQHRAFRSEL